MDWDKNIDHMTPGEFNKILKAASKRVKETRLEDRLSRMLTDLIAKTENTPESVAEKMGCKVKLVEHIIRKGDGDMRRIASMVHVMGGKLTMDLQPLVSLPNIPSHGHLKHSFSGRTDRDCDTCGRPDRHSNHHQANPYNAVG